MNSFFRPNRSVRWPKKSAPKQAPSTYRVAAKPTCEDDSPSASFSDRREAIAPTIVTSSPSRIQTVPSPATTSHGVWVLHRGYALPGDRFRDAFCVDRDLAKHAADRVRVADEVDAGRVRMRLRAVHDGATLRGLDQTEVAHERLEPAAETGPGNHRAGRDRAPAGQRRGGAVEAVPRGDDLALPLLHQRHEPDVEDRRHVVAHELR